MLEYCEKCRNLRVYTITEEIKTVRIKDKEVKSTIKIARCDECNGEIFLPDIHDCNLKQIQDAINTAKHGKTLGEVADELYKAKEELKIELKKGIMTNIVCPIWNVIAKVILKITGVDWTI